MNEHDEKTKELSSWKKSNLQQMNIQWNSDFSNLQWKQKLERKIGMLEKSEVKLECSGEEWETSFGFSYREVSDNEGSRDRDFIVI